MLAGKIPCCIDQTFFLNSNQGVALFRQKQILRSNRHKNLQKQNNEDFFIQLLNAWLHFTNSNFPTRTSNVESLDQPIFLNLHPKLEFSANNPYFYCIQPRNISNKYTIIKHLYRFLQPGLTSSMTSDEKVRFPNANHKRACKFSIELIPNNWKYLLKHFSKLSFKNFITTIKALGKYKTSKNSLIRKSTLSFNLTAVSTTNSILCPRCKELFNFKWNLVFHLNKLRDRAAELGSKETFFKTF